jgi:hypothetical protein
MIKNLLLLAMLVSSMIVTRANPIVLGENENEKLTMTYLTPDTGEDLKVKFDLVTAEMIAFEESYVTICCHTEDTTEEEPVTEDETTTEEEQTNPDEQTEETTEEDPLQEETNPEENTQEETNQENTEEQTVDEQTTEEQANQDQSIEEQTNPDANNQGDVQDQTNTDTTIEGEVAVEETTTGDEVTGDNTTNEAGTNPTDQTTTETNPENQEVQPEGTETTNDQATTDTTTGTRRRRLAATAGKCFGFNFNCNTQGGCGNSLAISVQLYGSQVDSVDTMVWAATTTDLAQANIGVVDKGDEKNYATRYRFNQADSVKSNIPRINEVAKLTCYSAFKVTRSNYDLSKQHDLKDNTKFPLTKDVIVAVKAADLGIKEDSESSGAMHLVYSFGCITSILMLNLL